MIKQFASKIKIVLLSLINYLVKIGRAVKDLVGALFNFIRSKIQFLILKIMALFQVLSKWEKWTILILIIILIGVLLLKARQIYHQNTKEIPGDGGIYLEGMIGEPRYINPIFARTSQDQDLSRLIFAGLTRINPEGKIEGDLAASWEISDDGLTYTFKLKDDLFWHDNQKITSDDVLFTASLLADPDYSGPLKGIWNSIRLEKVDEKTLKFILPEIWSPFLAVTNFGILPVHILGQMRVTDLAESEFNLNPVGCGPYKVERLTTGKAGLRNLTLEAFDKYHFGKAHISKVTFIFYSNLDQALKGYQQGAVIGLANIEPEKIAELKNEKNLILYSVKLNNFLAVFFNLTNPVLQDVKLRESLVAAIDKSKLKQEIFGESAEVIDNPILSGLLGFSLTDFQKFDLNLAKQGLAGRKINLTLVTSKTERNKKIAEFLVQSWKEVGVEIKPVFLDQETLQTKIIPERQFDLLLFGINLGADPDPYPFWHSSQIKEGLNITGFNSPQADKILVQSQKILDENLRAEQLKDFQDIIGKEYPALFLVRVNLIFGAKEIVKGITYNNGVGATSADRFYDVQKWYIKTKRVGK